MAGAEIIGAAIGVLLLVLVGYIMVGSTLTSAEIVASAQKDLTMQNEARLRTEISIDNDSVGYQSSKLIFNITNTGSEVIGDFNHMDVYVAELGNAPMHYKFNAIPLVAGDGTSGISTWGYTGIRGYTGNPEIIHPGMLDPDEKMTVEINNMPVGNPSTYSVTFATPNGVSDIYNKQ